MRLIPAFRHGLFAAAALVMALPANSFGIGLQPTTVEMSVEPGDRQRQVIHLGNVHQTQTISLTLGLADWTLDEAGQIKLVPPGERLDSASEWVRFSPAFVTLEPGETEQIIVDMATPIRTEREGDYRFALIASTILPEERSGQSGVWKKYQIASLFYLTMGDAISSPAITATDITMTEDGTHSLGLTFENAGNAHARLRGQVEIKGDNGDPIKTDIENLVILHEGKREYKIPLGPEIPANPTVEVSLENIFAPQSSTGVLILDDYVGTPVLKLAEASSTAGEANTETPLE